MRKTEVMEPNYQQLFEACPHPYLIVRPNSDFTIIAVDDRYLAVTGTARASILGRGLFEVFPDNPDDLTATGVSDLRISLERVIRDGVQDVMGVQKYDIPREDDGKSFVVKYWSPVNTPVFDDDGTLTMIIHHVEDVTEFILVGQRGSPNTDAPSGIMNGYLERMEAEVLRRSAEVKAANRQIKALLAEQEQQIKQQRQAELARMDERLKDLGQAKADLLADIFLKFSVSQSPWVRYPLAFAIVGVALGIRMLMLPVSAGLPFVTFYPALILSVFLCGLGPGLLSSLLGLFLGYFAFMPPFWTFKFAWDEVPVLTVYSLSSVFICVLIDQVFWAAGKLGAVNQQLVTTMEALKQDIAERQRTEQSLRDSEEQLRTSFEYAAIGKVLVALDGRWLQANAALISLLGYSEQEIFDLTFREITHPEDWARDRPYIKDLLEGRCASYQLEKRLFRKNGEIVWVLMSASLLRNKEGKPLHFIAQIQDVTEQKHAEQRADRLRRIVTVMSEGNQAIVHATEEKGLFQAICDVVVTYGGYRMAWIGLAEHDAFKTIRPVANAGHEDGYLSSSRISWGDNLFGGGSAGLTVRTGQPQINDDFSTNPGMQPWRYLALERDYKSSISLPIADQDGVFGILGIYSDEIGVFGAEEVKLLAELAEDMSYGVKVLRTRREHEDVQRTLFQVQKMESLGQLTGGIAHDFNNLLQVILSNLDLALHARGTDAITGYLQSAIAGGEQGAKLTSHLLSFARRQPLQPKSVRVDRLVGEMTQMLRRTLGQNIDIEVVNGGGLWTAHVDANQLQNAILNLALNARDAMGGGGQLTVELGNAHLDNDYALSHREVKAGQYVMLAITDTGAGMSEDILEKVFEPFFTTKPEGSGTGLGLSMVYGFVKQSGGHIKIYSEVGHGTTVKLYLPRSHHAEAEWTMLDTSIKRGNGETILVAEDDAGVRVSVVTQLAELGYRVLSVGNGQAALDILQRGEKVDLLFTDIMMPGGLNGRVLADKAVACRPDLLVVFTSGYTENAIIHHGRLDEGVTLLSKPYRLVQLADTIHAALARGAKVATDTDAAAYRGHVLLVEDDTAVREVFLDCLEQFGYHVVSVEQSPEALRLLESDNRFDVLLADFNLPGMNGIALAREALDRHPSLAIVLASGQYLDACELPDPAIQILTKPVMPQAMRASIETALKCVADREEPACKRLGTLEEARDV